MGCRVLVQVLTHLHRVLHCSPEDARRKRAKGKQNPGQEAAPAEPAAACAAALSTKQRKKAEREVCARFLPPLVTLLLQEGSGSVIV